MVVEWDFTGFYGGLMGSNGIGLRENFNRKSPMIFMGK